MYKFYCAIIVFLFSILVNATAACTDFQVKAEDNSVIIARSMEFAIDLKSEVVLFPRGLKYTSVNEKGVKGISWTSKYGFLAVDAFGEQEAIMDGMNEAGLSIEFLWFPGSQFQEATPGKFIAVSDMAKWVLGSFASIDEIKKALPKVNVISLYIPELGQAPGLHAAVHDASGNNIVIEFIDGKTIITDNPLGVMTNRPSIDWHLNNLRNYFSLAPEDIGARKLGKVEFSSTGAGNGWLGLPGDWMPPSRFVKAAYLIHTAEQPKDAKTSLNFAQHVMNTVDIPYGLVREHLAGKTIYGYTQWLVFKDLTNRAFYYSSYQDPALKKIELEKLNFAVGTAIKSVSIESESTIIDTTDQLI
ncbi:MAG: choloylglycine hydrolase family protein [Candidatus Margulisbacteria bacterium]|nr:choloylglycine hydrolase family protein [Candidatus Margulisiibacteriota bacterium]